jgi:glyoxylase-like metal-dependent hydrolase (beta-lactamase superfamily II)
MKIDKLKVGMLRCNCYILSIDDECIVIDPGGDYDKIKDIIGNKKVIAVLITHNHFDHVGALDNFDVRYIYDFSNLKEQEYIFSKFKFEVIKTPGHSSDLLTYYFADDKAMFTGDFLFKDCIGRTDLFSSSNEDMINSLNKIVKYDDDITIFPGHGDNSTIKHEKLNICEYLQFLSNK